MEGFLCVFLLCMFCSTLFASDQIAGGQGQVSHFVELLVWAPVASVAEGGEHHVEAESNIQLHCQLRPEANLHNNSSSNDTNSAGRDQQQQTVFRHLTLPTVRYSTFFCSFFCQLVFLFSKSFFVV